MNKIQRQQSDENDRTIMVSIDYHGPNDGDVLRYEAKMTRNEMRATMVWITKLTFGDLPTQNMVTGLGKIYHLFRRLNTNIDDRAERRDDS